MDPCDIACRHHDHPRCTAALNLEGEHYRCDLNADHLGWAHENRAARAIWKGTEHIPPITTHPHTPQERR